MATGKFQSAISFNLIVLQKVSGAKFLKFCSEIEMYFVSNLNQNLIVARKPCLTSAWNEVGSFNTGCKGGSSIFAKVTELKKLLLHRPSLSTRHRAYTRSQIVCLFLSSFCLAFTV